LRCGGYPTFLLSGARGNRRCFTTSLKGSPLNTRLSVALLIFVFISVSAPQTGSSQVPALWSKAHAVSSQIFPMYAWREVEKVLVEASKQEIQEFVAWTPEAVEIS